MFSSEDLMPWPALEALASSPPHGCDLAVEHDGLIELVKFHIIHHPLQNALGVAP
jgi:hypothetical protein